MSKLFISGMLLALTVYVGSSFASPSAARNPSTRLGPLQDSSDATVVGTEMTVAQVVHSRLHSNPQLPEGTPLILDMVREHPNEGTLGIDQQVSTFTIEATPEQRLSRLVATSDAIVIGRVQSKKSNITADGAFLFTDYEVQVVDVLKNNVAAPIGQGASITVTRRGGKVIVNGVVVSAETNNTPVLKANAPLVLVLKWVPATGAYITSGPDDAFEIDGEMLRPVSDLAADLGILRRTEAFVSAVRSRAQH